MKKTVLCILLVLGMVIGITGNLAAVDVTLGVKAGPVLGFLTGEDWDYTVEYLGGTNSVLFSFTGGFFLGLGFHHNIAMETGLHIIGAGGKFNGTVMGYSYTASQTGTGLELPIMIKPRFPVGTGELYLLAGPDIFLYLTDVSFDVDYSDPTILDEHVTIPVENSFLFGFSVGGGYSFPAGPGTLSFDLRYSRMITQTFQNSIMVPNVIGLYIGYGFTL